MCGIARLEVPEHSIHNLRYATQGRGATPGCYTGLYRSHDLWMSPSLFRQANRTMGLLSSWVTPDR
jgi:hypothetical protein